MKPPITTTHLLAAIILAMTAFGSGCRVGATPNPFSNAPSLPNERSALDRSSGAPRPSKLLGIGYPVERSVSNSFRQVASNSERGKIKISGYALNPDSSFLEATLSAKTIRIRNTQGAFFTFTEKDFDLDLIELSLGKNPLLARGRIPDGTYDRVEILTAGTGSVTLTDGRRVNLILPKPVDQNGPTAIRIFLDHAIVVRNGKITSIAIEFDLSQSFRTVSSATARNTVSEYQFTPVIHARVSEKSDQNKNGGTEENDASTETSETAQTNPMTQTAKVIDNGEPAAPATEDRGEVNEGILWFPEIGA